MLVPARGFWCHSCVPLWTGQPSMQSIYLLSNWQIYPAAIRMCLRIKATLRSLPASMRLIWLPVMRVSVIFIVRKGRYLRWRRYSNLRGSSPSCTRWVRALLSSYISKIPPSSRMGCRLLHKSLMRCVSRHISLWGTLLTQLLVIYWYSRKPSLNDKHAIRFFTQDLTTWHFFNTISLHKWTLAQFGRGRGCSGRASHPWD